MLQLDSVVQALAASCLRDRRKGGNAAARRCLTRPICRALKSLRELAARIGERFKTDARSGAGHISRAGHCGDTSARQRLRKSARRNNWPKTQTAADDSVDRKARLIALDTLLRANTDEIRERSACRAARKSDAELKQIVRASCGARGEHRCLSRCIACFHCSPERPSCPLRHMLRAVDGALNAWETTQRRLDQLLMQRIDNLRRQRLL